MGTILELRFTQADTITDFDDKTVAMDPRKQSWVAALAVLFTFSAASALVQLLIGLLEAKINILAYGSKLAPSALFCRSLTTPKKFADFHMLCL